MVAVVLFVTEVMTKLGSCGVNSQKCAPLMPSKVLRLVVVPCVHNSPTNSCWFVFVMPVQFTCHDIEVMDGVKLVCVSFTMEAFKAPWMSPPLLKMAVSNALRSYTNHHKDMGVFTERFVASMSPVVEDVASTTSISW